MLPMGIYTIPEILCPENRRFLQRKENRLCVGRAHTKTTHAAHHGDTSGLLKIIFSPADKKLLGLSSSEKCHRTVHIGMMVLDNGLTIDQFIDQVFNYPTSVKCISTPPTMPGNLSGHKLREG